MSVDIGKLIADRERKFIEQRVVISQWVKDFMANVKAIDPSLLSDIAMPKGNTAEELLPSLFTEPFDHEAYLLEREKLETFRLAVNSIACRLNEEAMRCLQQLKAGN
jgi:hypothetical protein